MSCEISVIYPGLEHEEIILEIPETRRAFGIVSFGSDPTVCFGSAPGMGGFVLDRWEAEEYGILPRHCALLWAGGKFRLEFDRHAGVYLNGSNTCARSFCNPFEDGNEFTMRLGLPVGDARGSDVGVAPVFKVRRKDKGYRKAGLLTWLSLRSKWFRRVALMPTLVRLPALVMAVATMGVFFLWQNLQQDARITEALIRGDVPIEIGEAYQASVASIGTICPDANGERYVPYGTAWLFEHAAVGVDRTYWLVTNQHVVAPMNPNCEWVAKFPSLPGAADSSANLPLQQTYVTHPLFHDFEAFSRGRNADPDGQPTVANLYDIAAFKLSPDDRETLTRKRRFFKLPKKSDRDDSSLDINVSYEPGLEPGRPVLILSYPTENQPFLTSGVSEVPFQFRTSLQSKTNAMSQAISDTLSVRTPSLFSFSAKSAGGMSGSPMIAIDEDDNAFIGGIVFAASFVAVPDTLTDEPQGRLASGDGTYALDAMSLASLPNWAAERRKPLNDEQKEQILLTWASWADAPSAFEKAWRQFSAPTPPDAANVNADVSAAPVKIGENLALSVCSSWQTLNLSRRVSEAGDVAARGIPESHIRYKFSDGAERLMIVAETPAQTDNGELIQMAILTNINRREVSTEVTGLDQAVYVLTGKLPEDIRISVAGPLNNQVVLTVYEAIPADTCPERENWNG